MLKRTAAMGKTRLAKRLRGLQLQSKEVVLDQEYLAMMEEKLHTSCRLLPTPQKLKRLCPCRRNPLPTWKRLNSFPCRRPCPCLCRPCRACLHLWMCIAAAHVPCPCILCTVALAGP